VHKSEGDQIDPITWDRLKSIFGRQKPIRQVTQRQFDGFDDVLERLSRTPVESIDFADLWYYHHDLAYVTLQEDLFAHLFPVCLMDWHESLLANRPCSHGDSEFHYGIIHGEVLRKMLTLEQRAKVELVFRDSMLHRMDQERGFVYDGSKTPAYGWIHRLNSFGLYSERLADLWNNWWGVETPGRAVCLLQYCSGLMYLAGENPIFPPYTAAEGGGGPYLWENDSNCISEVWTTSNLEFVRSFLTADRVAQAVQEAAAKLDSEPERQIAAQIAADLNDQMYVIESRIDQLPDLLASNKVVVSWWL
jgi:hypothetical protein